MTIDTALILDSRKPEPIMKANGTGWGTRVLVVGGSVWTLYTLGMSAPFITVPVLIVAVLYGLKEMKDVQDPRAAERIKLMMDSCTPRHPSINRSMPELRDRFHSADINTALSQMVDHCEWIVAESEGHRLRGFGELYCYVDPDDQEVLLPLEGLFKKLKTWGIEPYEEEEEEEALPGVSFFDRVNKFLPWGKQETVAQSPWDELESESPASESQAPLTPDSLAERLKAECPAFLALVKAPPIRLVGVQRTGKSTFARKLLLLRAILLPGHQLAWATPHQEIDNPVPEQFHPFGSSKSGKDYPAIEAVWGAVQDAIDAGTVLNLSAVWDEFGGYDAFHNPDILGDSLRSLLRESTKHGYFPILVAHGDTANQYPGVKGMMTTLKEGTVKVETIGTQIDSFGTMAPTGKARITWLDGETSEIQCPDWLTVDLLLSMLPPSDRPTVLQAMPVAPEPAAEPEPELELWIDDAPNPVILSMSMADRAQFIVDRLKADGFQVDRIMTGSLIVIAGSQRGGKGTLAGLLCILQQALTEGETAIKYYTAGNDLYPFKTMKTVCAQSFQGYAHDLDEANHQVANALAEEVDSYRAYETYEREGEMLIIDEAIALSLCSNQAQTLGMASYLIRQFAKSGATGIVVLHANNLTSWVGTGNTGGLAQAFKVGATLIGCKSKPMQQKGLRMTSIATGEYFFADPAEFGTPLRGAPELGTIPDWLLVLKHPGNGAPDPIRSLLAFFPEMVDRSGGKVTAVAPQNLAKQVVETEPDEEEGEVFAAPVTSKKEMSEHVSRIQGKLIEKIREAGGDWVNVRELLKSSFSSAEDRQVGQLLIDAGITRGMLEGEVRENINKTESKFVRVTPTR